MKNKKKVFRHQHIWFSIWSIKTALANPKCDDIYQPLRVSNK